MPAPRIRIEYDVMDQIVKKFFTQADLTNKTLERLSSQAETFHDGVWVGKGAKNFNNEMNSSMLPAMQGLSKVLEEGGQVTQKINQIMRSLICPKASRSFLETTLFVTPHAAA